MKIISLSNDEAGYACAIGTSIKKYYKDNVKTNFFDYLVVSMKSVNEILNLVNFDLLKDNIDIKESHENTSIITWKYFDKLISYHDLKNNFTKTDYIEFCNKYKRRWIRFIHLIYEEDVLFFVRYGKVYEEELNSFYKNINFLNKKLIFYFINIDYNENNIDKQEEFKNYQNYIYINFYLINNTNNDNDDIYYRILNYNWNFVFKIIEKNYHHFVNNKLKIRI